MKNHPKYTNYLISEDGEIFSLNRNKFIKPSYNKQGYLRYSISHNKKANTLSAHRLVAETFIPNPLCFKVVNHKNGIKDDNRVSNLEWCTHSYNTKHAFEIGLITISEKSKRLSSERMTKRLLTNHPNLRPVSCYNLNHQKLMTFKSIREGSLYYGISESAIGNNLIGRSKTCNQTIWIYE